MIKGMLKRLQHIRFRTSPVQQNGNELFLTQCHRYAQEDWSIVPMGSVNDTKSDRPCYLFT